MRSLEPPPPRDADARRARGKADVARRRAERVRLLDDVARGRRLNDPALPPTPIRTRARWLAARDPSPGPPARRAALPCRGHTRMGSVSVGACSVAQGSAATIGAATLFVDPAGVAGVV